LGFLRVEFAELFESVGPKPIHIGAKLAQAFGLQAVVTARALLAFRDQLGVLEDAKMLRYGGPRDGCFVRQRANGERAGAEGFDKGTAGWIGENVE